MALPNLKLASTSGQELRPEEIDAARQAIAQYFGMPETGLIERLRIEDPTGHVCLMGTRGNEVIQRVPRRDLENALGSVRVRVAFVGERAA